MFFTFATRQGNSVETYSHSASPAEPQIQFAFLYINELNPLASYVQTSRNLKHTRSTLEALEEAPFVFSAEPVRRVER
jgi:hypothetical protein